MVVVKKGYTIEVVSWENDGDNYKTKSMIVEDKDEAIRIGKMCRELFTSSTNGGIGIGNLMDDDEDKARGIILNYLGIEEGSTSEEEEEEEVYKVMEINGNLLGGSEWYYSRICESVKITYSPIDIDLEEIDF